MTRLFKSSFGRLSAAGFAATAVTFGPGRMGFGLFLPEFREAFSLSTGMAGALSSLGFAGFLAGLIAAEAMLLKKGPGLPVMTGLLAAAAGMACVAMANGTALLATGVFLSMSSAGFTWAPFNAAIHNAVGDGRRPAALSLVSTGTSLGVALAGGAALALALSGLSWRACWAGFALAGILALLLNRAALRGGAGAPPKDAAEPVPSEFAVKPALPLLGLGLSFGTTTAIYISFAADRIAGAGGVPGLPPQAAPAVVFICYGLFGLAGLATAAARRALGLDALIWLLLVASAASSLLAAFVPRGWAGVVSSAGLQGLFVMMTSAVMAFWSERRFPKRPAYSFTAVLLAVAVGSVLGPALAGLLISRFGGAAVFAGSAFLSALTAVALRPRLIVERPRGAAAGRQPPLSAGQEARF